MVVHGPLLGGLTNPVAFFVRHSENSFDGGLKGSWCHEEVCSKMPGFRSRSLDENSPVRTDEPVHGRSVGCDDERAAAHCFDDVVSPTFGE